MDYKLLNLVAEGGLLPSLDHAVPLEVSLEACQFYVDYPREAWQRLLP